MGNRRAREHMLDQICEAEWARVKTRLAIDDVHARGIGMRRLQLVICPSFDPGKAWEVRQLKDQYSLFSSDVLETRRLMLRGYKQLAASSHKLMAFFTRACSMVLPVSPYMNGWGGADGTIYQLALFGDMCSECRFQWWSEPPPNWQPLVELAGEMIVEFSAAQPAD